jgi:hypothetical protein
MNFIQHREPTYLFKEPKNPQEESIEEHYVPKKPISVEPAEEEKPVKKFRIEDLLDTLKVDLKVNPLHTAVEKTTVSFIARDDEGEMYNSIVKALKPEPSDNPAVLGKFELWNVLEKPYIVTKDPMTLNEVVEIVSRSSLKFEAYVEDTIKITTAQIEKIIESSLVKVRAYSKRLLRFEEHSGDSVVLAELVLDKDYIPGKPPELFNAKIKIYVKKVDNVPKEIIWTLHDYIDYISDYLRQGVLLDINAGVIAEAIKKRGLEGERALQLLSFFNENIELFKEVCRILKKTIIRKSEERLEIFYSKLEGEFYIYIDKNRYYNFIALVEAVKEVTNNA